MALDISMIQILRFSLLFAGPLVASRVAPLSGVVSQVSGRATIVGLAALSVVAIGLLGSLLTLSPFAHFVPIALVLLAGLMVYRDVPIRPAVPDDPTHPGDRMLGWLGQAADATAPLADQKVAVGLVALGAALIHLVAGDLVLL